MTDHSRPKPSSSKSIPKAVAEGVLRIGEIEIPCAVLEGGLRVFPRASIFAAVGRQGKQPAKGSPAITVFRGAKNIEPFIHNDLKGPHRSVRYLTLNGQKAEGVEVDVLPKICSSYTRAFWAGVLQPSQVKIARRCQILQEALSTIGITALVDEATGYREKLAGRVYGRLLEKYMSANALPYTSKYPDAFWEHIFRLKGKDFDKASSLGERWLAGVVNELVNNRLLPAAMQKIHELNPVLDHGRRGRKIHQYLTPELGEKDLLAKIHQAIGVMQGFKDGQWDFFIQFWRSTYIPGQQLLFSLDQVC